MAYSYKPATTEKKMTFSLELQTPKFQNLINRTLTDKNDSKKFVAEIMTTVAQNPDLQRCDNLSILAAGLLAQSMNLPLSPSLGFAYIIPFNDYKSGKTNATFQIGYKGLVQLCLRTGKYERIGMREVHEGEFIGLDEFGEPICKFSVDKEDKPIIGYFAYLKLTDGLKKTLYWSKAKCASHGNTYGKNSPLWKNNFDFMAKKTVLKQLVKTYGYMSTDIARAIAADQAVVNEDNTVTYVDTDEQNTVPLPAINGEVKTDSTEVEAEVTAEIDEEKELF